MKLFTLHQPATIVVHETKFHSGKLSNTANASSSLPSCAYPPRMAFHAASVCSDILSSKVHAFFRYPHFSYIIISLVARKASSSDPVLIMWVWTSFPSGEDLVLMCQSNWWTAKYRPPLLPIGKGTYGIVFSTMNSKTNKHVAIKKISNAFENCIDAKWTVREIKLRRHMDYENVSAIRDVIPPPQRESFDDVYIAYELMDTDLHQIIRSNQASLEKHC